jgi:hypothetical protein
MRAHTIISIIVLGALAIPASAVANTGYSSVNATTGASGDSGRQGSEHSSLNSITGSSESSSPSGSDEAVSGYTSLNAISGPSPDQPRFASGSPSSGDQFDWSDAVLGAGAAMALVAFGGAALLTVRRRTAMSPSASAS